MLSITVNGFFFLILKDIVVILCFQKRHVDNFSIWYFSARVASGLAIFSIKFLTLSRISSSFKSIRPGRSLGEVTMHSVLILMGGDIYLCVHCCGLNACVCLPSRFFFI